LSEEEGAADEYDGGRPLGLYLLVGVIVVLVAVSGMFAIGYIPPLAKIGSHTTSTSSTRSVVPFITVTTTIPPSTTTITGPGTTTTITNSTTITTTTSTTSTSTKTTTQTIVTTTVSTSTTSTTIYTPTTTTSTTITTTTTTIAPPSPLSINVTMRPGGIPATLHPGESFVFSVTVNSTLPMTSGSLSAYQATPLNTPLVTTFYPSLPESLTPVQGISYYTLTGTIGQGAPVGSYEVDVTMAANSPVNNTQMSVTKQFLINVVEPLTFTGFKFVNATTQFNGTCIQLPLGSMTVPTWGFQCRINAAPMVNGTVAFMVSNAASVPICIQTSFASGSMTGFVNMNPYPFCPDGAPGVYIPAGAVNYAFNYEIQNGGFAGAQNGFFTFVRTAT
jgi:hypothetical protein